MISLYSFIILLGLAVIVNKLFLNQRLPSKNFLIIKIVAVFIVLIGVTINVYSSTGLNRYIESKAWVEIDGEIISSEILGERSFYPEIIYVYYYDNIKYTDTTNLNIPGFGGKRKRYEVAREHISLYNVGDTIKIYIDRKHPENSSLTHSVKWSVFGQFSFGCLLLFIGFLMILMKKNKY